MIKYLSRTGFLLVLFCVGNASAADDDVRQLVQLPQMMQQHMMANMRDHLMALNEILVSMGEGELEQAADTAERRLGMSSLEAHGASHMARFMPEAMRRAGTAMHQAASRFALKAEEGELLPAYKMLSEITATCVNCHAQFRIR